MSEVFRRDIYPPEKVLNYTDDAAFRTALEALPCCVTNKDGSRNGDPLNLVVVGGLDDAFPAFARRGWRPTEQKWSGSITKMVTSALAGERYAYAPVSDLYMFGRPQDLALQKARDNIHQRNHLRLWLSPMRYHGKQVWVGQISRDIGSRLTIHSPTLTTHKIDPDVDEARSALAQDMAYSQNLAKIGYVKGVGAAPKSAPRGNLTTDPYYTDGLRVVLVFDRQPTSLADGRVLAVGGRARHGRQTVKPAGVGSMNASPSLLQASRSVLRGPLRLLGKRAVCGEPPARCRRLCDMAGSQHFQRRRVARTRRDCLQAGRERDGGGAERRGQPAHVRRRRQQDRRAVGMDRTPEPDTRALVAAEARIGPRLLLAARSRVVRAHAACAGSERSHRRPASTDSHSRVPSFRVKRARACFSSTRSASQDCSISICSERKGLIPFSLFLRVPDDAADPHSGTISFSYPNAGITDYKDLAALRAALERLPCCASDARGTTRGDPLNAIFVGELPDIAAALVRRSYRRDAQAVDADQHVFGRAPDFVLRKQAQAGAPSTWIRLWLAPIRFEGRPVFIVQVGRPVGGRFVPRGAKDIVLHEDVDEARNLLVQDMMYSGGVDKLGFATGVGAASPTQPRTTFGGARYHTDGLRATLFFATRPLSLADVEFLDWAPYLEIADPRAGNESRR